MLAQAEALKQTVLKILENRTNHARQERSNAELKALTPSSISHDDSSLVDELKLDPISPHDIDETKPVLDSAMHLD